MYIYRDDDAKSYRNKVQYANIGKDENKVQYEAKADNIVTTYVIPLYSILLCDYACCHCLMLHVLACAPPCMLLMVT